MRSVLAALPLVLTCINPLGAQQWTPEEREVLDHLEECWNIWMEGVEAGSPERWISECTMPRATYWSAIATAPTDNDYVRRTWETIRRIDLGWLDIRPTSLVVIDNVAVLHFYGVWRAATPDGETVTEGKRTEVFRRVDGRWKLLAGHWSPVTPADAEPYRN